MISLSSRTVDRPNCERPKELQDNATLQVRKLLSGIYPAGARYDRRSEQRHPFPRLFVLTPVDADGQTPIGEPITAAGKHISETGLSFFHPQPLPYRWVVATVEDLHGGKISFLMDLDWCRFMQQGWYESGGRFTRVVTSPAGKGKREERSTR